MNSNKYQWFNLIKIISPQLSITFNQIFINKCLISMILLIKLLTKKSMQLPQWLNNNKITEKLYQKISQNLHFIDPQSKTSKISQLSQKLSNKNSKRKIFSTFKLKNKISFQILTMRLLKAIKSHKIKNYL